jgi:hypothetical protein
MLQLFWRQEINVKFETFGTGNKQNNILKQRMTKTPFKSPPVRSHASLKPKQTNNTSVASSTPVKTPLRSKLNVTTTSATPRENAKKTNTPYRTTTPYVSVFGSAAKRSEKLAKWQKEREARLSGTPMLKQADAVFTPVPKSTIKKQRRLKSRESLPKIVDINLMVQCAVDKAKEGDIQQSRELFKGILSMTNLTSSAKDSAHYWISRCQMEEMVANYEEVVKLFEKADYECDAQPKSALHDALIKFILARLEESQQHEDGSLSCDKFFTNTKIEETYRRLKHQHQLNKEKPLSGVLLKSLTPKSTRGSTFKSPSNVQNKNVRKASEEVKKTLLFPDDENNTGLFGNINNEDLLSSHPKTPKAVTPASQKKPSISSANDSMSMASATPPANTKGVDFSLTSFVTPRSAERIRSAERAMEEGRLMHSVKNIFFDTPFPDSSKKAVSRVQTPFSKDIEEIDTPKPLDNVASAAEEKRKLETDLSLSPIAMENTSPSRQSRQEFQTLLDKCNYTYLPNADLMDNHSEVEREAMMNELFGDEHEDDLPTPMPFSTMKQRSIAKRRQSSNIVSYSSRVFAPPDNGMQHEEIATKEQETALISNNTAISTSQERADVGEKEQSPVTILQTLDLLTQSQSLIPVGIEVAAPKEQGHDIVPVDSDTIDIESDEDFNPDDTNNEKSDISIPEEDYFIDEDEPEPAEAATSLDAKKESLPAAIEQVFKKPESATLPAPIPVQNVEQNPSIVHVHQSEDTKAPTVELATQIPRKRKEDKVNLQKQVSSGAEEAEEKKTAPVKKPKVVKKRIVKKSKKKNKEAWKIDDILSPSGQSFSLEPRAKIPRRSKEIARTKIDLTYGL